MTTAAELHRLTSFVDGRRGWYIADPPETRECYAWRTVEVMDVAFHLFLYREADRPLARDSWTSSYRSDSGRLVGSWSGTYDVVVAEVTGVERCLETINALRECRTRVAARELVDPLKSGEVRLICHVLDISRAHSDLRDRVVQELCGFSLNRGR